MSNNERPQLLLFAAVGVALIGLRLCIAAFKREDHYAGVMVFMLAALGVWVLTCKQTREYTSGPGQAMTRDVKTVEGVAGGVLGGTPSAIEGALYSLRPLAPRHKLRYLPQRLDVVPALAALRPFMRRDKGAVWRIIVALEDFYARYHKALLLPLGNPSTASSVAATLHTLHDTRAEALNTLSTLGWTRPGAGGDPRVNLALETVRVSTMRCLGTLAARHAGSPELSAAEGTWRPPYPNDPWGRAPQVVHM